MGFNLSRLTERQAETVFRIEKAVRNTDPQKIIEAFGGDNLTEEAILHLLADDDVATDGDFQAGVAIGIAIGLHHASLKKNK